MSPELWVPGAGGPSVEDLVGRIHRTIEQFAELRGVTRPFVEVTLHDGTRLSLHSLRAEPGHGLVTLCPFPEGEAGPPTASDLPPEELIVPLGSIVRIRLTEESDREGTFGFALPAPPG
jgi:hypothetical protein